MKLSLSNSGISNGLKWPYLKLLVAPTSHLPSFHGNIILYSFLSPNLVAILDFASHDVTGGHSVGLLTWLAWVLRRCKFRCAVSSTNDTCQHSNCVHFKLWKQYLHTQGLSMDSALHVSQIFQICFWSSHCNEGLVGQAPGGVCGLVLRVGGEGLRWQGVLVDGPGGHFWPGQQQPGAKLPEPNF